MSLFWRSRILKFNVTDKRPRALKMYQDLFSQRVRFLRALATNEVFPIQGFRERRRRERRKIVDFAGNIAPNLF